MPFVHIPLDKLFTGDLKRYCARVSPPVIVIDSILHSPPFTVPVFPVFPVFPVSHLQHGCTCGRVKSKRIKSACILCTKSARNVLAMNSRCLCRVCIAVCVSVVSSIRLSLCLVSLSYSFRTFVFLCVFWLSVSSVLRGSVLTSSI